MKHSIAITVLGLLAALQFPDSAPGAQQGSDGGRKAPVSGAGKAAEQTRALNSCTLARSVLAQQGLLDPTITMLPSAESFGAANGARKLVVACGLSSDEIYTYSRLLTHSGLGFLAFKGDEAPERVWQQLADRLDISYPQGDSAALSEVSGSKTARLTLLNQAGRDQSPGRRQGGDAGETVRAAGLRDLYLLAKSTDPELGRSQSRVAGSKADEDLVRAGFHPRIDASAGISQLDQTVLNYPPTTTHSSVFGFNYDVSLRMPVLHLPIYHYLSSATAGLRGDQAGASAAVQSLIVKVADAYFAVLRAQTDQQIAQEESARLKQILDQAQAFLKAGTGDIISVYEAQARLDGVVADLNRAESGLRLAEQRLGSIIGRPVASVVDFLHLYPSEPEPDDLEWWLATMEKSDPQILQARESLAQTVEQTKAARAERYPVVDATAGYDVSRGSAFLPDVETHQWHIGATVSVSLYSGGESGARIRRAVANQEERRFLLDSTLEQRRDNLKQTFYNMRYNVSLIKALKQREKSSEVQLNAVKKGRSLGTRTAIDLLNAEQASSMAKRDLRNALYDNVVRNIQLKAAAGILDENDLSGILPSSRGAMRPGFGAEID